MREAELEELLRSGLRQHGHQHVPTDPGTAAEELVVRMAARGERAGRERLPRWGLVGAALAAAACILGVAIASSGSRPPATASAPRHISSHSGASSGFSRAQAAPVILAPESGVANAGAATGAPTATPLTVTASEGGRAFTVRRGEAVRVDLSGASLTWSVPRADQGGVLSTVSSGFDAATGQAHALFVATASGRSTVSATARPRCAPGSPCPQFVRYWTISVTVSG